MFRHSVIKDIILRVYGIRCTDVKPLPGHLDKNFWLKEACGDKEYVVRLKQQSEWQSPALELTTDGAIEHLYLNGFSVPHAIKTKKGFSRCTLTFDDENGDSSLQRVRLSEYLPGKSIIESKLNRQEILNISSGIGLLTGRLAKCMAMYSPPVHHEDIGVDEEYVWNTKNFYRISEFMDYVKDGNLHQKIAELLEEFKLRAHPLFPQLRHGYLHGDVSNSNLIILENEIADSSKAEFNQDLGIIDFEDFHFGATVFELTVCIAYMISEVSSVSDVTTVVINILTNFEKVYSLTTAEKSVLFYGVTARLASSYVQSLYEVSRNPENEAYLTAQARKCVKVLEVLLDRGDKMTMNDWFQNLKTKRVLF